MQTPGVKKASIREVLDFSCVRINSVAQFRLPVGYRINNWATLPPPTHTHTEAHSLKIQDDGRKKRENERRGIIPLANSSSITYPHESVCMCVRVCVRVCVDCCVART